MSDIAIRVVDLCKRYRLGRRERTRNLRDGLGRGLMSLFGRGAATGDAPSSIADAAGYFWAVKDLSFEIRQGDAVGLIGANGAGKSTVLKILARITRPTSGYAEVSGRVGSLLEVGTGFNSELSGRDNVYLSGAILGMRKKEIERKFDQIVDFAEVADFIDTPVKHYSDGMSVRLAFAVAAHLETDILLIDDVLAVGDSSFQKKCLTKMSNVTREGRTVVLVSHSMDNVNALCRTTMLLGHGVVVRAGDTTNVTQLHLHRQLGDGKTPASDSGTTSRRVGT